MSTVHARVALTLLLSALVMPLASATDQEKCVRVTVNDAAKALGPIVELGSAIVVGVSTPAGLYAVTVTPDRCLPGGGGSDSFGGVTAMREPGIDAHVTPLP